MQTRSVLQILMALATVQGDTDQGDDVASGAGHVPAAEAGGGESGTPGPAPG